MAINNVSFDGLNRQSIETNNALNALNNNTDMAQVPKLAALLQAQASALESLKKAADEATRAMVGKA